MAIEKYKVEWKVGLIFLVLCLGFIAWYSGILNGGKLTKNDVEQYLTQIDKNLNWPEEVKQPMLQSLRSWGEADDGKQFFMLNMMRFRDQVYQYPGAIKGFSGTTKEADDLYGHFTTDELIQLAGHPILWGDVQSSNITSDIHGPNFDNWNRIGVVRYPNRRAFFELMASEGYGETAAYKLMGSHTYLIPVSSDNVFPDLRLPVSAGFLVTFLFVAWRRSLKFHQKKQLNSKGTV